ncbi:hypothetical protein LPJ59_003563 [Coemansia sp. RSA 2399]|nr:hypothetical protein LPJ59_003563 [Coemansia sp. RSA 2399]
MSSAPYQKKAPWDRSNKYWCQYCRIYVHDNRSSRSIHESGTKHKANVQKYLRQITKDTDAKREEDQRIATQLEKIERAAAESYRRDVGDGAAPFTESAAGNGTATKHPTKTVNNTTDDTPSDGHTEHAAGGGEAARPSRPADVGIVGAWEVVEEPSVSDDPRTIQENATECSKKPVDGQSDFDMRGAEWLDDEDQDHGHKLTDFNINEKTLGDPPSPDGHAGDVPDDTDRQTKGAGAGVVVVKDLFKKRRVAGNRVSSRKQRKI